MKRLISLLLFLTLCCAVQASARMNAYIAGSTESVAASCTTSNDSALVDNLDHNGEFDNSVHACVKFTTATTFTLTEIIAYTAKSSGTSGGLRLSLYEHNSGTDLPSTEIAGTVVQIAQGSLPEAVQNVTGTLGTPYDLSAGTYWICSVAETDTVRMYCYGADTGARSCYGTDSCGTASDNNSIALKINGCAP